MVVSQRAASDCLNRGYGSGDPVSPEEQDQSSRQQRGVAIHDATIQNENLLGAMQHVPLHLLLGAFDALVNQQSDAITADCATTRMLMASHTKLGENNEGAKRLLAKVSAVSELGNKMDTQWRGIKVDSRTSTQC